MYVWDIRTREVCPCQNILYAVWRNYAKEGLLFIVFPTWLCVISWPQADRACAGGGTMIVITVHPIT